MRRQSNFSPICRCYCSNGQNDSYYNSNRKLNVVETCTIEDDCCCKCKNKKRLTQRSSYFQGENAQIDEETLRALCALRQKACKFINSETECTTTSGSAPHSYKGCPCQNQTRDDKYLIRIEDLLEYSPQSQFLKKLKKHFQCIPNDQPLSSILNERNKFISNSLEYKEDSREIANFPTKELVKPCKCCKCSQKEKLIEKSPQTVRSESEKSKSKIFTGKKSRKSSREKKGGLRKEEQAAKDDSFKKTPKKSQHISRPRKIVKNRGRRKKKSKDHEKQNSQEPFEPTLKRPHEDSCERCWRYASPSRSPVNKPDQRYNPNFRRAHSWQDFSTVKESASEYANSEILDKNRGPIKIHEELTKDFDFPSAQKQHPSNNYTPTRIKELEIQSSPRRSSEKSNQNAISPEVKKRHSPLHRPRSYLSKDRKPRPKSYTPGVSSRNLDNMSSIFENLSSTEYMKPQTRKESPKVMPSNRSMRSSINANAKLPQDEPSENKNFFYKAKTKSSPNKKKIENKDTQRLSQQEFVSVDFNKSLHCIPNPQLNIDTTKISHSKSTTNRPSSRYQESNQSPKIYSQRSERSASPKNTYSNRVPMNAQYFPQESLQTTKSQSSHSFQSKYSPPIERPRTVDYNDSRYTSKNFPRHMMRNDVENQFRQEEHEIRPCNCQQDKTQRSLKPRSRDYSSGREDKKKEYCCHCRKDSSPRNSYVQNGGYQDRSYNEMPRSSEIKEFEEQYPENFAVNSCRCSEWREFVDYNPTDGRRGKIVLCPYKQVKPEKYLEQNDEYPENQKYTRRRNQNYPSYLEAEHKNSSIRRGQSNFSNYVPTNYCVFYMKKNQENKEDEVEVLVEELTERPTRCIKKDCKTKLIEDKMRKIFGSCEDSMALRFQKGVSEVRRDPESSRTLYF